MNKTFKYISAIFVAFIISTVSLAQNPYPVDNAVVIDHYKNVVKQVPYDVKVCNQVRQGTSYGYDNSNTNEILGGRIGGAIGNKFGKGDGNEAATLAGIFLGASLAHDNQLAQGQGHGVYTTRCYYETRYQESTSYSKVYSHSTLTFTINGKKYRVDFVK